MGVSAVGRCDWLLCIRCVVVVVVRRLFFVWWAGLFGLGPLLFVCLRGGICCWLNSGWGGAWWRCSSFWFARCGVVWLVLPVSGLLVVLWGWFGVVLLSSRW